MLWSWNLAAAADLFGDDILKKSQQAYLAIQSYSGSTTVTHKMVVGAGTITQTGSARISFVRPGLIRIEGKDSQRQPFSIVSNGAETWLGWALQHDGQFRKVENLEVAVSAMTGVGVQAPTIIPAALLPLGWGLPWTATAGATLVGQESIGGVNCYKVVVQVPPGSPMSGTRTFWVDSQLFLLRKFQEERDEQDLARMQSELRRAMESFAGSVSGSQSGQHQMTSDLLTVPTIKSSVIIHSFRIEELNATIDAERFQDPTR